MSNELEQKQIEEIDELETVLYEANHKKSVLDYRWLATEAYNAGYRKQSEVDLYRKQVDELEDELASTYDKLENAQNEVAREIFEEIEKILVRPEAPTALFYHCSKHSYAELKKKYTENVEIVRDLAEKAVDKDIQNHLDK